MIFCRRSRAGFSCFCLPHFFSKEDSAFAGGGPRGSALGLEDDSDGKPCSGVRGGQQASTASLGAVRPFWETLPHCRKQLSVSRFRHLERSLSRMKNGSVKKLALAGMFCALCVVGSVFSFPMFGSKCAPVQHMVNVLCAVLLGPWWGVGVAFVASLLRNLLGLGSLMAFPGSMFGALLCGVVYWKTKNILATMVGEVFGTSILGGLCAYPVAIFLMGKSAGDIAFYAYIVPFLISTAVGSIVAGVLVYSLQRSGALRSMQSSLS